MKVPVRILKLKIPMFVRNSSNSFYWDKTSDWAIVLAHVWYSYYDNEKIERVNIYELIEANCDPFVEKYDKWFQLDSYDKEHGRLELGRTWFWRNLKQWDASVIAEIPSQLTREVDTPEGWVELDNGQFLYNSFGKYAPCITFVCDEPMIVWEKWEPSRFNFDKGSYEVIEGVFWESKKGKRCFTPKKDGRYLLICDNWGGAFNNYRGNNLERLKSVYFRRASSNGGGCGYDYAIVDKSLAKLNISIDDI